MLHQDGSKPANFFMHLLHRLLKTFILHGESFDFGLQFVEPCFLALTAFKRGYFMSKDKGMLAIQSGNGTKKKKK